MRLLFRICLLANFVFVVTKINSQTLYVPSGVNGISNSTNSNIGVKMSTPLEALDVNGNIKLTGTDRFLGTTTNNQFYIKSHNLNRILFMSDRILFYNNIFLPGNETSIVLGNDKVQGNNYLRIVHVGSTRHSYVDIGDNLHFRTTANWISPLIVQGDGNVAIGYQTTYATDGTQYQTKGHKLAVNGSMLVENGALNLSNGLVANGTSVFNSRLDIVTNDAMGLKLQHTNAGDWGYAAQITVNRETTKALGVLNGTQETFAVHGDGSVAIGTAPKPFGYLLSVAGNVLTKGKLDVVAENTLGFKLNHSSSTDGVAAEITVNRETTKALGVLNGTQQTFAVHGDGSVAIGTAPKPFGYMLSVAGKIIAEEIVVKLRVNGTFPDYVFNSDYKLRTLQEVEAFIQENGHLPEVPSAKEVEENGLGIGDMNVMLLKKVEELTLYVIELNKRTQALELENAQLKAKQ